MSDRPSPIPIPPPPEKQPGFPVWPLVIFGVLGAVFLLSMAIIGGAALFYAWQFDYMDEEYADRAESFAELREALREQGHPVSGEDLMAWYPPIEGPNAAEEYYLAIEKLGDTDAAAERTRVFLELRDEYAYMTPPEDVMREVRAVLAEFEPSVAHLRNIMAMDRARFDVDFTVMAEIQDKHIRHYSLIMRLVHLSADEATDRGAVDEAADWILCGLRITWFINEVPLMWSHTRTRAERVECIQTLRRNLSRRAFHPADLERLQAAFEAADPVGNGRRAMLGQRAYAMSVLANLYGDPPGTDDAVDMLGFYEKALADLDGELPERHSFESVGRFGASNAPTHLILRDAHRLLFRIKSDLAFDRLAIAVLAIERFRADHGRVPESLDELAGEYLDAVPIDPFDGHPLRYKLHSAAYFVYSVWADGEDGGGEMQVIDRYEDASGDQILYINRGLN